VAIVYLLCPCTEIHAQAEDDYEIIDATGVTGTRLVDYLASLREEGLVVIYSSELVPDSIVIDSEPIGATPRIRLGSALSAFGLALERGPQDTWLVVRASAQRTDLAVPVESPAVTFRLPPIENVIVTASRYAFSRDQVASGSFVDRLQLETTPAIGDDALRPLANVPGVSANGLSGRMSIRGGDPNEALILLDGVELRSPFHLKDFESIFGSISPRIVDRMDVYTGGFAARYGGRMSGVIDMKTVTPQQRRSLEAGISTINSSFMSSGQFGSDDGDWVVSLRRGTVDLLLDAANSGAGSPQFSDVFGRVATQIGDSAVLRFGLLSLKDKISLHDGSQARAGADYDDTYLWSGFTHELSESLAAQYLLSVMDVDSRRDGFTNSRSTSIGSLLDSRDHSNVALSAEWTFQPNDRRLLQWGVRIDQARAQYEFESRLDIPFPVAGPLPGPEAGVFRFAGRFADTRSAAFVSSRLRIDDEIAFELGARIDQRSVIDERWFSPRIGVVWDAGDRLTLRANWGRYTQPHGIDELQIPDRVTTIYHAQRSEQRVLSLEFHPVEQTRIRVEWFDKRIDDPLPRFENLLTRLSLLPELLPDRAHLIPERARASGVEFSLDSQLSDWRWWFSYSRGKAEDLVDNRWLRRSWQESWAAKSGFIWTQPKWDVAVSLVARAGWPISRPEVQNSEIVVAAFNDRAFENFRTLDVKATRLIDLRRGRLEVFAELINVFDANNDCCYEYQIAEDSGGNVTDLMLNELLWLPSVPVLGVLWVF